MKINQNILLQSPLEKIRQSISTNSNEVLISPLHGSSKSLIISELKSSVRQIVLLLSDIKTVDENFVELNLLNPNQKIISIRNFYAEEIQEKLTDISKSEDFILISTYQILVFGVPSKEKLNQSTTSISVGGNLSYDELIEYLNILNYTRDKFVEAPGYYSIRGSIIDFWSYSEKNPVRLEFDGDFIESIRYFDPESQRSTAKTERVNLSASISNLEESEYTSIFSYLNNPLVFASEQDLNSLYGSSDVNEKITYDESLPDFDEELISEIAKQDANTEEASENYHKKFHLNEILFRQSGL